MIGRFWLCTCGLALAFQLSGCVSNVYTPYEGPSSAAVTTDSVPLFDYDRREVAYTYHDVEAVGQDRVLKRVKFESLPGSHQPFRFLYYEHRSDGPKPLVMVLPIFDSYTYPSDKIAAGLLKQDPPVNVAVLEYEGRLLDLEGLAMAESDENAVATLTDFRESAVALVKDLRRLIDWAEQRPDIDASRVGLVSFSMSAFIGSLIAQHEPRMRANAIVMGSARYSDVLAVCEGRPGTARDGVMQRLGWSLDTYRDTVDESLHSVDPSTYPGRVDPARTLMIDADNDTCMPKSARDALWDALGRPERISYRYDHKRAFLAMTPLGFNVMRARIYDFFEKQFDSTGESGAASL